MKSILTTAAMILISASTAVNAQVSASISSQWYDLTVSDNGIGVAKDDLALLTQPFIQVERMQTARVHKGTGIGLTITQNLIEMHGGTLEIESELAVGTTVTIHLPRGGTVNAPL